MNDVNETLRIIEAEKRLRQTSARESLLGRLGLKGQTAVQVGQTIAFIWAKVDPYLGWLVRAIWWVFATPFKFFWRVIANKNGEFGVVRGVTAIVVYTVFMIAFWYAMFVAASAGMYLATAQRNEVVYLSNAQEISEDGNNFSVQGCEVVDATADFTCDESNSIYYRIESSGFAHLWSLFVKGQVFYPEYVAAPIAPGWQQCTTTSYGVRIKALMRGWDIYPTLLSANCHPVEVK